MASALDDISGGDTCVLVRRRSEAATHGLALSGLSSRSWDPSRLAVVLTCLLALVVVASRRVWPVARHVVTIAHEGGHAVAALASGRRIGGIRLHSDTSGVTVSSGRPRGLGVIVTVAAGYITPSLLGLGSSALLAGGHVSLMLRLSVVLLVAMLIAIRNGFGALSVLVSTAVVLAVSFEAPGRAQDAFALFIAWFLLFGGFRPIIELQRARRAGRAYQSDPDQLAHLTGLPALAWVLFFAVTSLACIALGATWLFG
jgi:Peptidase M50B-like